MCTGNCKQYFSIYFITQKGKKNDEIIEYPFYM